MNINYLAILQTDISTAESAYRIPLKRPNGFRKWPEPHLPHTIPKPDQEAMDIPFITLALRFICIEVNG